MAFSGKTVLITGASTGVGKAVAVHFANSGANLVLVDSEETSLQTIGKLCEKESKPLILCAALTDEEEVRKIIHKTIERYRSLHVLISCAITVSRGCFEETNLEQFDCIFNANVRSVFHLCKLAIPHLAKAQGSIVIVSSSGGINPRYGYGVFGMAMAAINQMTRCLALELAGKGVRVNSVNPGFTNIDIVKSHNVDAEGVKEALGDNPLGRISRPEDIAKIIKFLAGEDSSLIVGANLLVDCGRNMGSVGGLSRRDSYGSTMSGMGRRDSYSSMGRRDSYGVSIRARRDSSGFMNRRDSYGGLF